jgi:hypothetical protein
MEEIKLYKAKTKAFKLLALTILFVVSGIWLITIDKSLVGWLCTLFFGLGIPIGIFHLFDKRPQVVINESGIWDRTMKQDIIKWEQINEAYPIDIHRQKFISLVVEDSFVFKQKQYKWAKKISDSIGAQRLNLSLGQLNINEIMLTNFINEMVNSDKSDRLNIIKRYSDKFCTRKKRVNSFFTVL